MRKPSFARLAIYAAIGAIATVPLVALDDRDSADLLSCAVAIAICIALFVVAVRNRGSRILSLVSVFALYAVLSYAIADVSYDLHTHVKWLEHADRYRAELASQSPVRAGELQHLEWDSWGFAGMETSAYLVYDRSDALAAAARSGRAGRYSGIPCDVQRVRRLEAHYYSALFYTETYWGRCT